MALTKETISKWFESLQANICKEIELEDEKGKFTIDVWSHASGGGGRSNVMLNGKVLEKAGVNFSAVEGDAPEALLKTLEVDRSSADPLKFFATGVSIVMHPKSPMVPIIHMNVRYFELSNGTYWFGGGIDLTPHIIDKEQASYFHQQLKSVCDAHDASYYPKFKEWADNYFFLPHRNETRGVGGIFFDRLSETDTRSKEDIFDFVKAVGEVFAPTYTHLMHINKNKDFKELHTKWQQLRRGRYVEFNLVWDRGTKFGLQTGGRTESILMSMPPLARWDYDYQLTESFEKETSDYLKKGINWIKH
ncbi:oxygen-dependent coproporphyrinogen oxidase [Marivirga sp. S37H4]|uniref:coproporphyrinogen oxidase n=1 Tax=Marivirga aurantiaca TaxID=2802615 RepID=A0A935C4W3_9BACT|nr:oxygen-dependent coproporphyrinogen oxidase [Marivirga aurantiaca]MBK6263516.1 oxygen-dependent coproporphyrinogen oxidase [Marivirga aurantiaca]